MEIRRAEFLCALYGQTTIKEQALQTVQSMRGKTRPVGLPTVAQNSLADFSNSHCPWVYNCVGVNNHRHFLYYLICLELGILAVVRLTIGCEYLIEPYSEIITDFLKISKSSKAKELKNATYWRHRYARLSRPILTPWS